MDALEPELLARALVEFVNKQKNAALFAGAGVSVRAGLPDWMHFLEHLANVAEKYDATEANVIRKRAAAGFFLEAAQVYKSCPEIPEGEKFKQIAAPFENPPYPEKLNALASLPFSAIFTTNYDRSLHHAIASVTGRDAKCVEAGDGTMARAPFDLDSILLEFMVVRKFRNPLF